MKKLIIAAIAAMTMLVGCDKLPSVEKIEKLSTSIGYAAGMACDLSKISDSERVAILEVLDVVDDVVPAVGQSFTEAWKPVIDETVAKLVADGKIDSKASELIKSAMYLASRGIDYMFEVRWPEAKDYKELVSAAVRGFTTGFKTVITPPDKKFSAMVIDDESKEEFDKATKWFKAMNNK